MLQLEGAKRWRLHSCPSGPLPSFLTGTSLFVADCKVEISQPLALRVRKGEAGLRVASSCHNQLGPTCAHYS